MHSKLAGRLPLQTMIAATIEGAKAKIAAAESRTNFGGENEPEETHFETHLDSYEEISKLASALEYVGEKLASDSIELGGESPQGGMVLPTNTAVGGTQEYKKDGSKKHSPPMDPPTKQSKVSPGASNVMMDNQEKHPGPQGLQSKYPDKGPLTTPASSPSDAAKTAAARVREKIANALQEKVAFSITDSGHKLDAEKYRAISKALHNMGKAESGYADRSPLLASMTGSPITALRHKLDSRHFDYASKKHGKGRNAYNPFGGYLTESTHEKEDKKSKQSSALGHVLNKIAEQEGGAHLSTDAKTGGGVTLDSPAEKGPKPSKDPSGGNDARKHISSIQAAIAMKKVDGKAPQKKMLSEILSEPAQTKSTDSKVHENLRNATEGGVKIAAATALLRKIAEEGCKCEEGGEDCRHCKLKKALEKKSQGLGGSSMPSAQFGGGMGIGT
jgi:hypothetical protein